MQTFLPYPDFCESARILDDKRLGKQRVEAYQILRTLHGVTSGWQHHPAVKMWRGYESALEQYMAWMIKQWVERGFRNTMWIPDLAHCPAPPWLGDERFHSSHRSNLLRKDPIYYAQFDWTESDDLPYYWPGATVLDTIVADIDEAQ